VSERWKKRKWDRTFRIIDDLGPIVNASGVFGSDAFAQPGTLPNSVQLIQWRLTHHNFEFSGVPSF